jgi:hypothetical protein
MFSGSMKRERKKKKNQPKKKANKKEKIYKKRPRAERTMGSEGGRNVFTGGVLF